MWGNRDSRTLGWEYESRQSFEGQLSKFKYSVLCTSKNLSYINIFNTEILSILMVIGTKMFISEKRKNINVHQWRMIKWVYPYYRIFCSYENNEMLLCSNEEWFQTFPIVQGRNVYTPSGSILV